MSGSGRQPLLWAALAFAAGLTVGLHAWRPPTWWLIAASVLAASATYLMRTRAVLARLVTLCGIFVLGALTIQVRHLSSSTDPAIFQFADGQEVRITGHVIAEGNVREEAGGDFHQRLDVESEQIDRGGQIFATHSGVRVSFYSKAAGFRSGEVPSSGPMRLFRYGERLRFSTKLNPPRNYRNPGAFDYQGYLAENGVAVLASTDSAQVEVLPGFAGSRAELWRIRIHRSILEKVHAIWPEPQAVLMDTMVIGEEAFLNRRTRMDFQRSGTYHVLVVS